MASTASTIYKYFIYVSGYTVYNCERRFTIIAISRDSEYMDVIKTIKDCIEPHEL